VAPGPRQERADPPAQVLVAKKDEDDEEEDDAEEEPEEPERKTFARIGRQGGLDKPAREKQSDHPFFRIL
jgi:hypothetical protein